MPSEQHPASGCTFSLTAGSWDDAPTEEASYNRNIERWLASDGSYPHSQSDTISGNRTAAWRLSSLQPSQLPSFQGLRLDEMSVSQANPTGLTARHSIGTLHPQFDAKGKWRYWPEWPGTSWNTPVALPQSLAPITYIANPFTEKPITDWSTRSQETQPWPQPIQHSEAVRSKESFGVNSLTNYWDSLSPSSASDYDSHWGPGTNLYSNATSTTASTFSQCSSSDSWSGPHNISGDPPNIEETDTTPPAKVSVVETSATRRSTLQPLMGTSRDAHQGLNANIPKSIPLECQFMVGYGSLNSASSTGTGNKTQGSQAPHDARDVSKPDPYGYHDPLWGGSLFCDQVECQTLNPSDIWPQAEVLRASELPLNTKNDTSGAVDQLPAYQFDVLDAAFSKMKGAQSQSHLPPVDQPNDTAPSKNSSQLLEEESYCTNRKPCSKSRNRVRDEFLVRSKLAGMSYKEIRTKGNFTEAESTLRGRFRTLTKRKEQRVRKPQWQERDVSSFTPSLICCVYDSPFHLQQIKLLEQAVNETLASSQEVTQQAHPSGDGGHLGTKPLKIPWKQVSEWIYRHGGSYKFGNATCRKKWYETFGAGQNSESGLED